MGEEIMKNDEDNTKTIYSEGFRSIDDSLTIDEIIEMEKKYYSIF